MQEELVGVWSDLGDAIQEPPRYLIEGVLPSGIVFVGGPPKSRKTTLEMALALLVAGYKNVNTLPPELSKVVATGRVMILSAEHSAGELRYMTETGMGVTILNDKSILIADDAWKWRLDDPDALEVLLGWLDALKPKLFIIDPLIDFHSLDEKESGEMNRLLRPIQKWAKNNDSCFMVVHHTAKKKPDDKSMYKPGDMRGASGLFGIADGVIMLTPMDDDVIHMEGTLKRGAPWQKAVRLGVWGKEQTEVKPTNTFNEEVLAAVKAGSKNYEVLAKKLKVSKSKIAAAIKQLRDEGMLDGVNMSVKGDT
jgi:RecA-family ATPase